MRVQRSSSPVSNRPVVLAALSAVAMLASSVQQSSGQTWVNPNTGNWSVGANWVGGVAPASSPTTGLVFNATGAETYAATNDLANPFQFGSLTLNNSGTGAITIAGNPFTGGTATSGAFTRTNSTGSGASNINNGGTLYSMRVGQGLLNVNGGAWTLASTQRQNDDLTTTDTGFWSLTVGDTAGQTARFSMTGGTINAVTGMVGSAPGSTGIATFSNAGTVFNATNATPDGIFGVSQGTGTISVLNGAVTNSRRVEIGRNANSIGYLRVDGANSRVNTAAASAGAAPSTSAATAPAAPASGRAVMP